MELNSNQCYHITLFSELYKVVHIPEWQRLIDYEMRDNRASEGDYSLHSFPG